MHGIPQSYRKGRFFIADIESIASSLTRAAEHACALQDLLSLSPESWSLAHKKAMLARLEVQYSLSLLKPKIATGTPAPKPSGRALDLERGSVDLSSRIASALRLCRGGDLSGCAMELYAADSLLSKMVPRLKKEGIK